MGYKEETVGAGASTVSTGGRIPFLPSYPVEVDHTIRTYLVDVGHYLRTVLDYERIGSRYQGQTKHPQLAPVESV